jgi:hypothetical protein|nr:MAG TPA: hypothetical protein [Caudoviricetes sp.]
MQHIKNKSPQEKITVISFLIVMLFLLTLISFIGKTI